MATLYDKVAQFEADADLTHKYVHGPATGPNSVITTESGQVPTLAKQRADLAAELGADAVLNESSRNAQAAGVAAESAESFAGQAEISKAGAQAASGVAYAANRIFATPSAGQSSALVSGDYFYVNASTPDLFELWIKGASSPTNTGRRVPSSVALARVGADRARNERFLNRFDKNSRTLVAGYISNTGVVTPSGAAIAEGVTVVTPLIGVAPGETLYLSQVSSNAALIACYDANLGVTGAATLTATFVVPAGVFYIQPTLVWQSLAYISSYGAAYYDFGYTADDLKRDFPAAGTAVSLHKASLAIHAGLSNLADSITTSALVDALGVLTISSGTINSSNKIVSNRVPVVPGATIKLTATGITAGYIAEYDINGAFIVKGSMSSGVNYTVSANTCYYYAGYNAIGAGGASATLINVNPQAINAKVADSLHADVADALAGGELLKNVSLFSTTIASQSPSDLTVTADADGFVFTALTTAGGYALFSLSPAVLSGEKYQITVDYEVLELNCTSVQIVAQSYFAASGQNSRVVTADQISVRNTLTVKSLTANGTNFTCGVKTIAAGAKINTGLAYFAKVRIRRVSIVAYADKLVQLQNIERVLGEIPEGAKNFSIDAIAYNKYVKPANFQGYSLVRVDHIETTKNLVGKTLEVSTAVPNQDQALTTVFPPALDAGAGFSYIQVEVTLNALNADYLNLVFRVTGGDETIEFTRADIGKKRLIQLVRKSAALSAVNQYILFSTTRVFTGGVSGVGLDGGSPTANITINSATVYASQNLLPTSYHADFFDERHTADVLMDYVKQPVRQVIVNEYGDSISEHNYAKFLAASGYDFKVNIYGLRGPVSEISSGPGTGACATFGVMTDIADVVLTMFGTHDWGKNAPIGAIGTLDKATYIGAYEVLIRGLIAKYPGKLIVPVSMPPRGGTSSDAEFFNMQTATGVTVRQYVNALRDLCNFYGLPFVDAYAASGANQLTMTGNPNLYVPGTTSDNTLIDATGAVTTNAGWFTSDFISVVQGKTYGTPIGCYFVEYNGSTFIRRSAADKTRLYMHPSTTRVKLCVSKSETVIDGTTIGVGPTRFWFADQLDAYMPDRIHPNAVCQARIGAAVSSVLKPILDARRMTASYMATIFNNAD